MWSNLFFRIPILFLLVFQQMNCENENWKTECPKSFCTCHITDHVDIMVQHLLEKYSKSQEKAALNENNNEVLYEENMIEESLIMKSERSVYIVAMCVISSQENADALFNQLPNYIQALTILQSADSSNITLRNHHFKELKNLLTLDIRGYDREENRSYRRRRLRNTNTTMNSGGLFVQYDALDIINSLLYLNIQNIKFITELKNEKTQNLNAIINEIPTFLQESEQKQKNLKLVPTFIIQPESNNKIVPYDVYKTQSKVNQIFHLNYLIFLRLFSCDMKEISGDMFGKLSKLQYFSLENNHLLFLPEFTFYGMPNLKILVLSHNKLLSLQSTSLAGLLDLEILDLSHNNISHLSELSLPPLPKLYTAFLAYNPLESIFSNTFEIMNETRKLYLGSNEKELLIQPNTFSGLKSLTLLHINNIKSLLLERELFQGMPNLEEMKLTGTINELSYDVFIDMPKLQNLELNNCKIRQISMDTFYGLHDLVSLDLSNNLLQHLPPGLFDQQVSLVELFLQNNKFTKLPVNIFSYIPAKMIRLDGNPWHCSCSMMDWNPQIISSVKIKSKSKCQFQYDKGNSCKKFQTFEYVHDSKVAPKCFSPVKYREWDVFHVLRKELRCKKSYKIVNSSIIFTNQNISKQNNYFSDAHRNLKSNKTISLHNQTNAYLKNHDSVNTLKFLKANKSIQKHALSLSNYKPSLYNLLLENQRTINKSKHCLPTEKIVSKCETEKSSSNYVNTNEPIYKKQLNLNTEYISYENKKNNTNNMELTTLYLNNISPTGTFKTSSILSEVSSRVSVKNSGKSESKNNFRMQDLKKAWKQQLKERKQEKLRNKNSSFLTNQESNVIN